MFTSLTETNPASEYQNPPSRSSVFNGYSINDDRYLVSRILADQESILRISEFEAIEQITSAYADRDTDTLNKGGKCDRRLANKKSDAIANHTVAIAFATRRNLVFFIVSAGYTASFRPSNPVSHHHCVQSSHINSRSTILITFLVTSQFLKVRQRANNLIAID